MAETRVFNLTNSMEFDDITTYYDMSVGNTNFSTTVNVSKLLGIQAIWSGLNANDSVIQIQVSNDNTNYSNYYGSSSNTLSSASGNWSFAFSNIFEFKYLRITVTVNTVTVGSLILLISKK